jgi:hypothetical protein
MQKPWTSGKTGVHGFNFFVSILNMQISVLALMKILHEKKQFFGITPITDSSGQKLVRFSDHDKNTIVYSLELQIIVGGKNDCEWMESIKKVKEYADKTRSSDACSSGVDISKAVAD